MHGNRILSRIIEFFVGRRGIPCFLHFQYGVIRLKFDIIVIGGLMQENFSIMYVQSTHLAKFSILNRVKFV
jgi:hypothetical protein